VDSRGARGVTLAQNGDDFIIGVLGETALVQAAVVLSVGDGGCQNHGALLYE